MSALDRFKTWRRARSDRGAPRVLLERAVQRWALTFVAVAIVALPFAVNQFASIVAACMFFGLLSLHFLLILLRKLHFSLLELLAAGILIGTLNGLLLSMPGLLTTPLVAATLTQAVTAWVFYGVVNGLICAELLGASTTFSRLRYIAAAWLTSAAPALLISGGCLLALSDKLEIVSASMHVWIAPLLVLGALGLILKIVITVKVRRKALPLLNL